MTNFGRRKARQRYQHFIAIGLETEERPHLIEKSRKPSGSRSELERDSIRLDERILGSEEFAQTLGEHQICREGPQERKSLSALHKGIADFFELVPVRLVQRGR